MNWNWQRALEGAIVSGLLTGASAFQVSLQQPQLTLKLAISSAVVTAVITIIKGFGQSYQAANPVTTVTLPTSVTPISPTKEAQP